MRTDPETVPSESDVEALYERLFGTPALDAVESDERDELDAYAAVYEVARDRPSVALRAAYEGVAAHFRGEAPFDYSVGETRTSGEVAP